jgi:hypothetical protein
MKLDIELLEDILNKLWLKPLEELKRLFFDEKNEVLCKKYNIDFSSLNSGQSYEMPKGKFRRWWRQWIGR